MTRQLFKRSIGLTMATLFCLTGFAAQAMAVTPQIKAADDHAILLKNDGTVWQWVVTDYGRSFYTLDDHRCMSTVSATKDPVQITGFVGVVAIAAGKYYNIALMADGTVWAWGRDPQIDWTEYSYSCTGGTFSPKHWKWQIIDPSDPTGFLTNVTAIWGNSGSDGSYFARKSDSTVLAWGNNQKDKLGVPASLTAGPSVDLNNIPNYINYISTPEIVRNSYWDNGSPVSIASGATHSLAILNTGKVVAWSGNAYGERGDGTDDGYSLYWDGQRWHNSFTWSLIDNVTEIAAGHYESLALKNDGTVWAWGWNKYGELGSSILPISVRYETNGTGTPTQVPGIPGGVSAIAFDSCHSLAMLDDGTVWAWGVDDDNQLGVDWRTLATPPGRNPSTPTPVQVTNLTNVTAIATAEKYSVAMKSDGTVWQWGNGDYNNNVGSFPGYIPSQVNFNGPAISVASCGTADGQTTSAAPTRNLCLTGTSTGVTGSGPWSWNCSMANGSTVACSTNITPVPIDGVCGPANGMSLTTPPTTDFCATGAASSVTGNGPWNWTCAGQNGGSTATCSANKVQVPVDGVCGPANGTSLTSAPTTGFCTTGTASSVTGSGPWNWTCAGQNGGSTVTCSANIQSGISDVSSQVAITKGGFRYDRKSGNFLQQFTLKNSGGSSIAAPLYLVLDSLSANATLVNKNGTTSATSPSGSPYIVVGNLNAGDSTTVNLTFANPTRAAITYSTRVLAGSGTP